VEDHADQVVGRDLHSRSTNQPLLLVFQKALLEIAAGLVGA
jgi:hypothetical protein